jgi:membrane protein
MERVTGRLRGLRVILDHPRVGTARAVLQAYDAAGGGLLAGGLAYAGLFAVLSGILFVIGVTGFFVQDSERLAAIVSDIGRRVPPLEELVRTGLSRVSETAATFSIVGLAGLAWGASRFYAALDIAFARVFQAPSARGFASQTIRGLVVVGLLLAVTIAATILASVASFIDTLVGLGSVVAFGWQLATRGLGLLLQFVAIAVVLRYVPPYRPSWRALAPPAIAVALLLSAFTNAFVVIQARLVGSLELFSGFAVVLATMIWLSIGFQLLLVGAAWTHVREPGPVRALDLSVPAPDTSVPAIEPAPPAVARPRSSPDGDLPS